VKLSKRSRLLAGIITTGSLIIGGMAFAAPAEAAAPTTYTPTAAQRAQAIEAVSQVEKFDNALSLDAAGNVHFNATEALADGGNATVVAEVARGVAAVGGVVVGASVPMVAMTSNGVTHCYGSQSYSTQWFGHQLKVNTCTANKILSALAAGAAIATIAAIVLAATGVGGTAAAIVAGFLALGAAAVGYCSADRDAAILDSSWAGGFWCANQ